MVIGDFAERQLAIAILTLEAVPGRDVDATEPHRPLLVRDRVEEPDDAWDLERHRHGADFLIVFRHDLCAAAEHQVHSTLPRHDSVRNVTLC